MPTAPHRSDKFLRSIFYEIVRGHSITSYRKEEVYLKHFTYVEQGSIEEVYKKAYDKAREQGLETEKECYAFLEKEGIWTKAEEGELQTQKQYLDNLYATRKKIVIPSQVDGLTKDIQAAEEKINEIEGKKISLLPDTCESYAKNKSNDLIIYESYYSDKEGERRLFSWEEYCALSKQELHGLFEIYNEATKDLSLDNIKHLALSNFFGLYANVLGSKNVHLFMNKAVYQHTFYQLHLLNYTKTLYSILENVPNIPDNVKEDPDQLIDYASASSKSRQMKQTSQDSDGYTVVGASAKDMEQMGVKDSTQVDINKLAEEKGGALSMEDFARFS